MKFRKLMDPSAIDRTECFLIAVGKRNTSVKENIFVL